jgi:hypothetical protein
MLINPYSVIPSTPPGAGDIIYDPFNNSVIGSEWFRGTNDPNETMIENTNYLEMNRVDHTLGAFDYLHSNTFADPYDTTMELYCDSFNPAGSSYMILLNAANSYFYGFTFGYSGGGPSWYAIIQTPATGQVVTFLNLLTAFGDVYGRVVHDVGSDSLLYYLSADGITWTNYPGATVTGWAALSASWASSVRVRIQTGFTSTGGAAYHARFKDFRWYPN